MAIMLTVTPRGVFFSSRHVFFFESLGEDAFSKRRRRENEDRGKLESTLNEGYSRSCGDIEQRAAQGRKSAAKSGTSGGGKKSEERRDDARTDEEERRAVNEMQMYRARDGCTRERVAATRQRREERRRGGWRDA